MNLHELIDTYVAYRRALGLKFDENARILRAFSRAVGADTGVADVRPEQVRSFLDGNGPLTGAWHRKHQALLGFYRHAVSRGHVPTSPLPDVLPQRPPRFVPYIYTHGELHRLLLAASSFQSKRDCVGPVTMRTILLLLYGAGLRISEALGLNCADVDMEA